MDKALLIHHLRPERLIGTRADRVFSHDAPHLLGVAIESTFNWYWLVDGLRAKNFPVTLVNTSAIQQSKGLKRSDDQYDAWWLAHTMRLGILAKGYICPREERAVRDLLRKRTALVQQRSAGTAESPRHRPRDHR